MSGLIAGFKTIFYFLAICFSIGTLIWIFKDLKPWRKDVRTKIIWPYLKKIKKKLADKNI